MQGDADRDRAIEHVLKQSRLTSADETAACIDAETLAAWADGGLSPAQSVTSRTAPLRLRALHGHARNVRANGARRAGDRVLVEQMATGLDGAGRDRSDGGRVMGRHST